MSQIRGKQRGRPSASNGQPSAKASITAIALVCGRSTKSRWYSEPYPSHRTASGLILASSANAPVPASGEVKVSMKATAKRLRRLEDELAPADQEQRHVSGMVT